MWVKPEEVLLANAFWYVGDEAPRYLLRALICLRSTLSAVITIAHASPIVVQYFILRRYLLILLARGREADDAARMVLRSFRFS